MSAIKGNMLQTQNVFLYLSLISMQNLNRMLFYIKGLDLVKQQPSPLTALHAATDTLNYVCK